MKELNEIVERENRWAKAVGNKLLSLNSAADRAKIAQSIDCALSPENLSCDGELTRAQVNAKFKFLTKAGNQLKQLDPSVEIYELY